MSTAQHPTTHCRITHLGGLVLILHTLAGCAMPDVTAFAQASATLRQAVAASGEQTLDAMRELAVAIDNDVQQREVITAQMIELDRSWRPRVAAIDVCVGYAHTLGWLIEHAATQRDQASMLAAALEPLIASTPIGSALSGIGLLAHETITEIRTAAALRQMVAIADPLIQQLAAIVVRDLEDVHVVYMTHLVELKARATNPQMLAAINARIKAARTFDTHVRATLAVWARMHHDLVEALRIGRSIDTTHLRELVRQLRLLMNAAAQSTSPTSTIGAHST